MQNTGV